MNDLESNVINAHRSKSWKFSNKIASRLKKAVKFKHEIDNLDKTPSSSNNERHQFMKHANSNDFIFNLSQNLAGVNLNKTNSYKVDFVTQRTQSFLDLTSLSKKCTHCTQKHRNKFINTYRKRHCHCRKHQSPHQQIKNIRIPKNYNPQNYRRLFGSL